MTQSYHARAWFCKFIATHVDEAQEPLRAFRFERLDPLLTDNNSGVDRSMNSKGCSFKVLVGYGPRLLLLKHVDLPPKAVYVAGQLA